MKCSVCNRRMRSGKVCFECDGCGNTTSFLPIEEVIDSLEGNTIVDDIMDAADEVDEKFKADAAMRHVKLTGEDPYKADPKPAKSQKKSKGKKK